MALAVLTAGSAGAATDEPVTLRVAVGVDDVGGAQDPHTFTGDLTILDMVFEPLLGPAVSGFEVPVTEYDLDLAGVTVSR